MFPPQGMTEEQFRAKARKLSSEFLGRCANCLDNAYSGGRLCPWFDKSDCAERCNAFSEINRRVQSQIG
jgi:hypothetical protein